MPEVPIPFTDEEVDTDDDTSSIVMTLVVVALGFGLLAWLQGVGGMLANKANNYISGLIGVDPTSGEDSGVDLV
jgi:hypothetical protein